MNFISLKDSHLLSQNLINAIEEGFIDTNVFPIIPVLDIVIHYIYYPEIIQETNLNPNNSDMEYIIDWLLKSMLPINMLRDYDKLEIDADFEIDTIFDSAVIIMDEDFRWKSLNRHFDDKSYLFDITFYNNKSQYQLPFHTSIISKHHCENLNGILNLPKDLINWSLVKR